MNIHTKKMSDLQLTNKVLNLWDPLGVVNLSEGGSLGAEGEYNSYAGSLITALSHPHEESKVREILDQMLFKSMGLARNSKLSAEIRYFTHALFHTWENHQRPESNLLISSLDEKKLTKKFKIVQQFLHEWDPRQETKNWLFGEDSLKNYDTDALYILEALEEDEDWTEISFRLHLAKLSENGKKAYQEYLSNTDKMSVPTFVKELIYQSMLETSITTNLQILLETLEDVQS